MKENENPTAADQGTAAIEITATVCALRVANTSTGLKAFIELDEAVPVMVKGQSGVYDERGTSTTLVLFAKHVVASLYKLEPRFELLIANADADGKTVSSRYLLPVLLKDAKVSFTFTPYEQGDEYALEDGTIAIHQSAGFDTDITEIVFSEDVDAKLTEHTKNMFIF